MSIIEHDQGESMSIRSKKGVSYEVLIKETLATILRFVARVSASHNAPAIRGLFAPHFPHQPFQP